ncbi:hypothetical protein RN001_010441 [Aquatica leii]|uniref:Rho-GAP domain-containing protein n=1 Tax=Aquatica leii TaxID=1421715 RepID=A0AAN7SQB6_9COLE|nr:hypothetical protein RN001_010441 [Aquatica leii]
MYKYRTSLENWLENLRYLTENYDPYVVPDSRVDCRMNRESVEGEVYENIWNCTTDFEETKLHFGKVCRISFEFNDAVEDFCVEPVVLTHVDFGIPTSIVQWKSELMYEYSSEDEDLQEYASLEKINEERTNVNLNQTQPFPIETATVDVRHNECIVKKSFRSQTVHEYALGNLQQQLGTCDEDPIDIKGVVKIYFDGVSKKLGKNNWLRIVNDQMLLVSDKEESVLVDCLSQTRYKPISKKEVTIVKTNEDLCKIYKLQFDNVKDLNVAIVDLESYYGIERSFIGKSESVEEKSQIRYKLLKLLGKRSSKDLLEKKGILKNEPIFGNTLRHLYEMYKNEVPDFVIRIMQLIELPRNISSVGLYRASGNLATIQKIRFHIDKNNLKILDEFKNDIDVLTGSLKLFFRELKEPLIPHKIYEDLSKYIDLEITPKIEDNVKNIVNKMDKAHKRTLLTLLDHLLKVESCNEENRMDVYNISIVWGPTLIWPPDNCYDNILLSHTNANKVVELLLNVYKRNEPTNKLSKGSGPKNALIMELNENLTHVLRKDSVGKSTESLTKSKSLSEKESNLDLDVLCAATKEKIPEFLLKTIPLIERGIDQEHLYKKQGSSEKLARIRKKLGKNKSGLNSLEKYNVYDLTSAMKNFFVDLKAPLIPKDIFNLLVQATDERLEITKLRNTKRELIASEIPHRETLDYLLKHLVEVSRHEESNKMSKHNLAVEWAPIICRSFLDNYEFSFGCCVQVFETLLQIYDSNTVINMELDQGIDNRLGRSDLSYLGRSPDKSPNQVLPTAVKRRPKLNKNESSLYRASRIVINTFSLYDNVRYSDDRKAEATILDETKKNKSMEDRTKL